MGKRERPKPHITFHFDGDMKELEEYLTYLLAETAAKEIMKSMAIQADSSE